MENEVTRQQMDETRASLSEKLETLEQQVVDTVQGATDAVSETVENVKDAVHDTVENVKDTFDLHLQAQRHPWVMVGGSIALGYLGGYLLFRNRSERPRANGWSPPAPPDSPRTVKQQNGIINGHRFVEEVSGKQPMPKVSRSLSEPGWLSGVNNQFATEISQLKGLVIGTVLSIVRDMISQSAPEPMKTKLAEVMDGITVKLGGEPSRGPVLPEGFFARGNEHQERDASEMVQSLGPTRR